MRLNFIGMRLKMEGDLVYLLLEFINLNNSEIPF